MEQPFIQVFLDCQLLGWSLEGHLTIYRHVNFGGLNQRYQSPAFLQ